MIPFNFEYHKPRELYEAITLFQKLEKEGKDPMYFGGGTEIITMARLNNVSTGAVIDIKGIPNCNIHEIKDGLLILGSGLSLRLISEKNAFPLLSKTIKRIADHTVQNKITLGGNLAGTIIYHESLLPLLVTDSQVKVVGINGDRIVPVKEVFNGKSKLAKGEIIVQIVIEEKHLSLPYIHVKRTKNEKVDYPLVTMVAIKSNNKIHMAFSGLCDYPLRSIEMEDALSMKAPKNNRINQTIEKLPNKILNNLNGSSEYRRFVLQNMLDQTLCNFKEEEE